MKKQHLFIILFVVLLGFVFGIVQYYQALKTEDVSAVTVDVPNPGHSLAQLECSADSLCVDTVNKKVGIGTNNPLVKLHVYSNSATNGAIETIRSQGKWNGSIGDGGLIRFTNYHSSGTNPNTGEYNLAGIKAYDYDSAWGGALDFQTPNRGVAGGGNLITRMTIIPGGNIGIGTTTPTTKLDVSGSMTADGMPAIKCPIVASTAGNLMTLGTTSYYSNGNISCNSNSIIIGETGLYLVGYTLGFNDSNHGWLMKNISGVREMSFSSPTNEIFSDSTILYLSVGETLQIYHYSGTFNTDGNFKYIWATKLH
jgi:hypothetical protein